MLLNNAADAEPSSFIVAAETYTSDRGYRFASMQHLKICSNFTANSLFFREDLEDFIRVAAFVARFFGIASIPNAALVISTVTFNRAIDRESIVLVLREECGPKTAATAVVCPNVNSADPEHEFADIGFSNAQDVCLHSFGRRPSFRKPSKETYSMVFFFPLLYEGIPQSESRAMKRNKTRARYPSERI
jgi:hypothetical protein